MFKMMKFEITGRRKCKFCNTCTNDASIDESR